MGWYAMGLVDTLEHFQKEPPRRSELTRIIKRHANSVTKVQDRKSGGWWDSLDVGGKEKNYLESSGSAMFVYAIARGVREGYLPERHMKVAVRGWNGIKKEFIKTDTHGNAEW